jgi:hypothetical protein
MFNQGLRSVLEQLRKINAMILPFELHFEVWLYILGLTILYNICYTTFSIAFAYDLQGA